MALKWPEIYNSSHSRLILKDFQFFVIFIAWLQFVSGYYPQSHSMERLRISSLGVLPDFLQPQIRICQDYIILARHISFEKAKDLSDVFVLIIHTFCCIVTTKSRCFFAIQSSQQEPIIGSKLA